MFLPDIVIILSRVSESGNVGAVCRAMKNMGLTSLRLVAPSPLNEEVILARAIHADDIWKNARFFDTLADAAADCSLLVGTTRRRGRKRKNITLEPRALVEWLVKRSSQGSGESGSGEHGSLDGMQGTTGGPIAFVFGNERTGLEDDELDLCNVASHIPVAPDFPSLNLSHAVQIYAYELFLALGGDGMLPVSEPEPVKGEWVPLARSEVDTLTASITNTLADLGFYKNPGREEQTRFLRDLISRAALTEREGQYFAKILAKAARLGIAKDLSQSREDAENAEEKLNFCT